MKKRVLFFCDTTAPGGVDTCTRDLALAARREGWETLVAIDRVAGADRLAIELKTHDIPLRRTTLHKQWDETERIAAVEALLCENKPHVVHVHLPAPWAGVVPRECALAANIPFVATEHNVSADFTLEPLLRKRIERVYQGSLAHVAVSHETKRLLVERFGLPGNKIEVISNAVDTDYWAPATTEERDAGRQRVGAPAVPIVICVARLAPQKGIDVLLRACALEPLAFRNWVLLLAGEGPDEADLRALAQGLGIADRLRWLGWHTDVRPFLAAADHFVLPSRWEGQPMTVLEAMAAGVPVVATAVSGTPEALDYGRVGTLVPPEDPLALSQALANELDRGRDETRVRLAREHVMANHNLKKNLRRTIALWSTTTG